MRVTVVEVGIVWMRVYQARVRMRMDVRFTRRVGCGVPVLVMRIVDMGMLVRHRIMDMLMYMPLREM